MHAEISAQETARSVHILGVNDVGFESANDSMMSGRALPWLQPVAGQDIWTQWEVTYRDVVILGPGNEHLGSFNLTTHDLADPANYDALMTQLLEAANE